MKASFRRNRHDIQNLCKCFAIISAVIGAASVIGWAYVFGKRGTTDTFSSVVFWVSLALWFGFSIASEAMKIYNKKRDRRKVYTHNIAACFVDDFEELLDAFDITIPDENREGNEDEARLYGKAYDDLLRYTEIRVISVISAVSNEDEIELVTGVFK